MPKPHEFSMSEGTSRSPSGARVQACSCISASLHLWPSHWPVCLNLEVISTRSSDHFHFSGLYRSNTSDESRCVRISGRQAFSPRPREFRISGPLIPKLLLASWCFDVIHRSCWLSLNMRRRRTMPVVGLHKAGAEPVLVTPWEVPLHTRLALRMQGLVTLSFSLDARQ